MAGVYKLEITETEADLKQRLRTQKTASDKERIQLLYLLKTEQATTIQAAAALLGRHRVTLQSGYASTAVAVWKQCWNTNPALGDSRAFLNGHKRRSPNAYTNPKASRAMARSASG
jgi:hypothetical protein